MSQQMLAQYYWLPTNGRLSFCAVESGPSSHRDLAIYPAYFSLARATTRPMVRACARPVWRKHQHTLSIVLILFCQPSLLLMASCACAHKTVWLYDGAPPQMLDKIISQVFKTWCPYYTVRVQIYLIDQPKILVVHRSWALTFYCAVANPARCIIIHKDRGWALLPTHFFRGDA